MLSVIWYSKVAILKVKQMHFLPCFSFSSLQLFAHFASLKTQRHGQCLRLKPGQGRPITICGFENYPRQICYISCLQRTSTPDKQPAQQKGVLWTIFLNFFKIYWTQVSEIILEPFVPFSKLKSSQEPKSNQISTRCIGIMLDPLFNARLISRALQVFHLVTQILEEPELGFKHSSLS